MKENKYDDPLFFDKYSQMTRSVQGLAGAGEWHELQKLLPDFNGKKVLDLGCGFGWHCVHAVEKGASKVVGLDLSAKMIEVARERHSKPEIDYRVCAVEDFDYPAETFDIVISSLTFHYLADFGAVCGQVFQTLKPGGHFVFSMEHPVFTAEGGQNWVYASDGSIDHWPVDRYFSEGKRDALFLGEKVVKYHRTLTTVVNSLLEKGFSLQKIVEPMPQSSMLDIPGMRDELRRPMMLLVSCQRPK